MIDWSELQVFGWSLWPMLAIALLGGLVCLERLHALFWVGWRPVDPLLDAVETLVHLGDRDAARALCATRPWLHLSWLGACALSVPPRWAQPALEEGEAMLLMPLHRRAHLLGALANAAVYIGLLGSVQGLIMGYENLARASSETKQTLMAAQLGIAIHTTLLGLGIAIPLVVARAVFRERARVLEARVRRASARLAGLLGSRRRMRAE
ncbi:MAG: MotA/TolQ/ExbB proton channel family protein [Myxococcota bacterium]|nr:MotA/TolQ/ExbB proton channel family protein [Myxococcota bacterium]